MHLKKKNEDLAKDQSDLKNQIKAMEQEQQQQREAEAETQAMTPALQSVKNTKDVEA